ncbi:MAG: ABC transporter permease subunit [Chloroflexota bacterium]
MSIIKKTLRYLINPRADVSRLPSLADDAEIADEELELPSYNHISWRHVIFNPALMLGTLMTLILLVTVLFGPLLVPHDPYITTQSVLPHFDTETNKMVTPPFAPSAEYPLGSDAWGNDMLSLIVYGARVTLVVGGYVTLARLVLGTIMGLAAGWRAGSWVDRAVMNAVGVVASIPMLLSAMIIIFALGIHQGTVVFVVALAVVGWTEVAQYVRAELLVIRNMPYVEGAQALGGTDLQILVRHVLPNLLPQLLILSFLEMGAVLILVAELGFLEVYVGGGSYFSMGPFDPTYHLANVAEWGALVASGAPSMRSASHLVLGPALAFFVAIVGMNALGEGLRRLLERATVNTAILLQRRTLLGLVLFMVASSFIIKMTGPSLSFARVAAEFDGERAYTHVAEISQLSRSQEEVTVVGNETADAASAYIQEKYREYEVMRGWKPPGQISQSYFYAAQDGGEIEGVLGFVPGYDAQLSAELIVLVGGYGAEDDLPTETAEAPGAELRDASGVALMLETVRLWQEQNVDPRRSLLLVAWQGERQELEQVLSDPEAFTFLPASTQHPVRPALVLELDDLGSGEEALWLYSASDQKLHDLFAQQAQDLDVPVYSVPYRRTEPLQQKAPFLAMKWAEADRSQVVSPERMQKAGELVNRSLLTLTRMLTY